VDRQLLTPLTRPFSTSRKFNNVLSRPAVAGDMLSLYGVLRCACHADGRQFALDEGGDISSLSALDLFAAVVDLMSEVVSGTAGIQQSAGDSGKLDGFEGLFRLISTQMFPHAIFEDHLTAPHIRSLSSPEAGSSRRERDYWLALNQFLPLVTPVFLSPVGSPTVWLSLIMHNGSLTIGSIPPVDGVPPLSPFEFPYEVAPSAAPLTSIGGIVVLHCTACDWISGCQDHQGINSDDGSISSDDSSSCSSRSDASPQRLRPSLLAHRNSAMQHCVRELCRRSLSTPDSVAGLSSRSIGAQW
jgi:hypothetical protein